MKNDYQWYGCSAVMEMYLGKAFWNQCQKGHWDYYAIVKYKSEKWKLTILDKLDFKNTPIKRIEPPIPNTMLIRLLFELDDKNWKKRG